MATTRVLILGAGFGGLTVASELAWAKRSDVEITVVDQRPSYVMGLAKLWALDGRRALDAGRHDFARIEAQGIRFVRGVVRRIDLKRHVVDVDQTEHAYDRLVIALGAELAPERLPGLAPNMDLYTEAGVEHLRRQLESFNGGKVLLVVASMPFKCPPAPYEAALLIEAMLRKRGVRAKAEISLTTPEPFPLPVAPRQYGDGVAALLKAKGIAYHPTHVPTSIDAKSRQVNYQNGAKLQYDVVLAIPPHRAPAVVADAGLTDETGWIPADPKTLRTRFDDAWAIGDVAAVRLPNGKLLPKAGTLAAAQGVVVARQILGTMTNPFDGHGVCYIETGDGLAIPARGAFYEPEPKFEMGPPSTSGLHQKERFEADFMKRWFG